MTAEFYSKLQRIYGGTTVGRDHFGRRQATPKEVKAALSYEFVDQEPLNQPTPDDTDLKDLADDEIELIEENRNGNAKK